MRIAIPYNPDVSKDLSSRLGTLNPVRDNRSSGRQQGRSHGRSNRRKSSPRPTKSAADLDAELDAYQALGQSSASLVSTGVEQSSAVIGESMEE